MTQGKWRIAFLITILSLLPLAGGRLILQESVSAFNPSENSIFITDYNPHDGGSSPCTGPGRLIRIQRLSTWEAGPTVSGLTLDLPNHLSFDASGRIYIADRENGRVGIWTP